MPTIESFETSKPASSAADSQGIAKLTLDADILQGWVGRSEQVLDYLLPAQAARMASTLGRDSAWAVSGAKLPDLWHWTYFLTAAPRGDLGRDGHAKLGGFHPPVALPRRMWAGGRLRFFAPLVLGESVLRKSTIKDVRIKTGRTGKLCFVTIRHEYCRDSAICISEEQDLVYREDARQGSAVGQFGEPAPDSAEKRERFQADPVLLFRYSALTFNGHRIHYDRDYARNVEGYSGLVVHGPLLATLLIDFYARQSSSEQITSFSFRGVAPLTDSEAFDLNYRREGDTVQLWVGSEGGRLAMSASMTVAK